MSFSILVNLSPIKVKPVEVAENQKYPNYCISPQVMVVESSDLGEWDDSHPLNNINEMEKEYKKRFGKEK